MNRIFLTYDVYERHRKVAESINVNDTVLDVGGELNHLSQFVHAKKLIVANLNTGDVIIKKNKLPFSPNSFDCVCSIDVLEHIPKAKRKEFINMLLDICKKKVILSFPLGTPRHVAYEKKVMVRLKSKGLKVTYLEEHILNGLPTIAELEKYTNLNKKISYSGDLLLSEILFNLYMYDPKIKFIRRLVYFFKLAFNLLTNPFIYMVLSTKSYTERVNRVYIVICK